MLILALDTSGKHGSLALARDDVLLETVPLAGGSYSAQLVPQLAALLSRHGLDKRSLDAFAVCSGPGSFTGLRVGLSAVKALAEVLHKPIVAISMLEAIAATADRDGRVLAALDAARREIFVGEYDVQPGTAHLLRELLLTEQEFVALVDSLHAVQVITPDESPFMLARALEVKRIDWPGAAAIARLAVPKIRRRETVSPEALEANYIRRSDAEIFSKPSS